MIVFAKRLAGTGRDVPAGLIDAGMASLAHFLTGIAAANLLGDANLGVYAVFFAAFMVSTIVPQFLVFTPAEVHAVSLPIDERLAEIRQSLRMGIPPTLVGAFAVLVAAYGTAGDTAPDVTLALGVTAGAAVLISPAQDHLRRLLHIARRSWNAAAVSVTQFLVVAASLFTMAALDVPAAWIPLGSLGLANIVSFSVGMVFVALARQSPSRSSLSFGGLLRSGRWLLAMALVPFGSSFLGTLVIVRLAGPEAMGYAEAARIAAQPILVLGTGLSAVLGPRGIEAAIHRNIEQAQRALRTFLALIIGSGLLYLLVTAFPWPGNPMIYLVPKAYEVRGLVAVTVVAHVLTAAAVQYTSELMGGRKEVQLTKMSLVASPFLLLGSATAAVTGAFARSLGIILEASVRYGLYGLARRRMYDEPNPPNDAGIAA